MFETKHTTYTKSQLKDDLRVKKRIEEKLQGSIDATSASEREDALKCIRSKNPDLTGVLTHLRRRPDSPLPPDLLVTIYRWLDRHGQLPPSARSAAPNWLFPLIEQMMSVGLSHAEACRTVQDATGYNDADPESLKRAHNRWLRRHPEHGQQHRAMLSFDPEKP